MSISQVRGRGLPVNHLHTLLDWVLIGAIKPDVFITFEIVGTSHLLTTTNQLNVALLYEMIDRLNGQITESTVVYSSCQGMIDLEQ